MAPAFSDPTSRRRDRTGSRSGGTRRLRGTLVVAVVALGLVTVLFGALIRSQDVGGPTETTPGPPTTGEDTAEFEEVSGEELPARLDTAKFISVIVEDEEPTRAYSLTSEVPEFHALAGLFPGRPADAASAFDPSATIVFVGDDRSTWTFSLDLKRGLARRGNQTWRLGPELAQLIEALERRSADPGGPE